jgi:hypothetical protein
MRSEMKKGKEDEVNNEVVAGGELMLITKGYILISDQ